MADAVDIQLAPTAPPTAMLTGRVRIYTDRTSEELSVTENILDELERVIPIHAINHEAIDFLNNYYRGYHPAILNRIKEVRPEIDNKIIVNYAYSSTRDITGYFLGKGVQYATRKGEQSEALETLNHALDSENKTKIDIEVATNMSICGVGYKGIFVDKTPRNGTHINLMSLNPANTFVVYSSGMDSQPMYAVTYWCNNVSLDDAGNAKTYFRVYTQTKQYDFVTDRALSLYATNNLSLVNPPISINFNGSLPIVEYRNNEYMLGDWEIAVPLMDGIDTLASDGVNDIEQYVQSILVAMGVRLPSEITSTGKVKGILNVEDIPQNTHPSIDYISPQLDPQSGIAMRDYLESSLRVVVGVPDRKSRGGGGGDTGDAVYLRDGWQDIDLVAANKEAFFVEGDREALNVILYILDTYNEGTNKTLGCQDVEIKFNRNKTSNLQSKVQSFQSLVNILHPEDALEICDLTSNPHDVIMRMEQYSEQRLEKQLEEQEKVSAVAAKFDKSNENVNTGSQPNPSNKTEKDD